MKKYLFLDMDGVMNCRETFQKMKFEPWWAACDPAMVERLNWIVGLVECEVVLSSSWRQMKDGLRKTQEVLNNNGATFTMIDETPRLYEDRGDEIQKWMDEHGVTADQIVILDDDNDMGDLLPRLVLTSMKEGLTEQKAMQVVATFEA